MTETKIDFFNQMTLIKRFNQTTLSKDFIKLFYQMTVPNVFTK